LALRLGVGALVKRDEALLDLVGDPARRQRAGDADQNGDDEPARSRSGIKSFALALRRARWR
jgi:hypothetical protein